MTECVNLEMTFIAVGHGANINDMFHCYLFYFDHNIFLLFIHISLKNIQYAHKAGRKLFVFNVFREITNENY